MVLLVLHSASFTGFRVAIAEDGLPLALTALIWSLNDFKRAARYWEDWPFRRASDDVIRRVFS